MNSIEPIFVEERREQTVQFINNNKKVTVSELCNHFRVSPSTIRTDLLVLEKLGLILRTHGGALPASNTKVGLEPLPVIKQSIMQKQKQWISLAANRLIDDGDIIAISTGTTTFELVKTLLNKKNLTIVVNDIQTANWLDLQTDHAIYMLGGMIRKNFRYVYFSQHYLHSINIDKIFFTCNGFTIKSGATIPDINLAANIRSLIEHSNKAFLLCDSSKFGHVSFAQIMPAAEIANVITDDGVDKKTLESFKQNGLTNLIVTKESQ